MPVSLVSTLGLEIFLMHKLLIVSLAAAAVAGPAIARDDGTLRLNALRTQCLYGSRITKQLAAKGHEFLCCRPCVDAGLNVPRTQWLSYSDVTQKLTVQGYQVHEIEVKDGAYEFEATNPDGLRVEAYVHPVTGEVFRRALCCDPCLGI